MLENLPTVQGDPLWDLLDQFNRDQRDEKIDLVVGVYRDESGQTPVMQKVQDAEHKLADAAASKVYKMLSGNLAFNDHIAKFLLGNNKKLDNQCTIQTVGGSGALRVIADLIAILSPQATIWNSDPGYINHRPIMEGAGLKVEPFRWFHKNGQLDIDTCFTDLANAKEGDVILLHGCCHNPTGIDPSLSQWQLFADFCKQRKVVPFIDMAYQGFGDDPDHDAAGLRLLVEQIDLVLVASSCSKNMGLYCERTGAATIMTTSDAQKKNLRTLLERITRANYSVPPHHGSAIASLLFEDPKPWLEELAVCRSRIVSMRDKLGLMLTEMNAPVSLQVIPQQKGMFSMLPLTIQQMNMLREEFAIYGLPNGRINIAGLTQSQLKYLADALVFVMQH